MPQLQRAGGAWPEVEAACSSLPPPESGSSSSALLGRTHAGRALFPQGSPSIETSSGLTGFLSETAHPVSG